MQYFNIPAQQVDMRDNYVILNTNSSALLKYVCTDACEGLNITTVSRLKL